MAAKVGKRIEVRLNEEYREKLERILECRDTTVSEFVRKAIEKAEVEENVKRLRELLDYWKQNPIDLPDPDELNRWLEEAYDPTIDDPELRAFLDAEEA